MMMDRYAVFGNPIEHSLSPRIHREFARQEGCEIIYDKLKAPVDSFASVIRDFFEAGGQGANVTVPFKLEAFTLADELSQRAQAAGAANTLMMLPNGRLFADNTDGVGLVADIVHRLGVTIKGKKLLILGAGGAVRGVLKPLLDEKPALIVVANRTLSKAHELAQQFGIQAMAFQELPAAEFDIIINATSGSLSHDIPPVSGEVFSACTLAYDMVYGALAKPFLQFALENGAQVGADGLGMLVGQAAESYRLWRGFSPDITQVLELLRQEAV